MPRKSPKTAVRTSSKIRRGRPVQPHIARKQIRAKRHWSKHLLLHPSSVFGLLLVGVLLTGMTVRAVGDTLTVRARIPAPPLTAAATIDAPTDGQVFTDSPITVSGTCPDESYVELYRNSMFSGAAVCVNNTYTILTDLFVGRNTLLVQDYNITDDPGPPTPSIDVTYAPPIGSDEENDAGSSGGQYIPSAGNNSSGGGSSRGPLLLWSDYRFNVVTTDELFTWRLHYQFGDQPFETVVDWGDNTVSHLRVADHQEFRIQHAYTRSGYYMVRITGTDAKGRVVHFQLAALIKKPGAPGTISSILSGGGGGGSSALPLPNFKWLIVVWPVYIIVGLMVVSFWLGERREYLVLTGRYQHRRRHA